MWNMGASVSSVLLLTDRMFWVSPRGACLCTELVCCLERRVWEETTLNSGQGPLVLDAWQGEHLPPRHSILLGIMTPYRLRRGPQRRLRRGPDVRSFRHLGWRLQLSQRRREKPNMVE